MGLSENNYIYLRQMIETFIRFDINKGMKIQYQDLEEYK